MTTPSLAEDSEHLAAVDGFSAALSALTDGHNVIASYSFGEWTLEVPRPEQVRVLRVLRDSASFRFEQLIDLCGVDYSEHAAGAEDRSKRFAVVYHLLSVSQNRRVRVVVYLPEDQPIINSVIGLWESANWYEREAFDLFGILFEGHPDLRRLLTDYGFVGHPFRKDFPLSGHVEMRFDEERGRVVYEPVSIDPRVTVPRVVRREMSE